jgi:hypothetical protein
VRLRLPVVVGNTGAQTMVVGGLRLIPPASWESRPAFAHTTWDDLSPQEGERKFFQPVPVKGYDNVLIIAEFHVNPFTTAQLADGEHRLSLELPMDTRGVQWHPLGDVTIRVTANERLGFGRPNVHFNGFRE